MESKLDFAGVVQQTVTRHKRLDTDTDRVITENFTYDHQNRLLTHTHQVDSNPEVLLAENTYDELSQLSNKKVGNTLQSIDYAYNIRGWMTHINRDQMSVPDLGGKLFAYRIRYNEKEGITNPDGALFSGKDVLARYNGNIAEVDWRSVQNTGNSPSLTPKRYGYAYDHLNRLRAGYYQNPQNPGSKENTESIDYDLNGNITNLYRSSVIESGNAATVIDRLEYFYASGNKSNTLDHITDHQNNPSGYEGGSGVIHHDSNGNMDKMQDKNIESIAYNYLNLPHRIVYGGGFKIESKYNASGIKLQKKVPRTECGIMNCTFFMDTTDYLDGFQYLTTTSTTSGGGGGGGSESESMRMAAESARAFEIQAYSLDNGSSTSLNPATLKDPDLQFFPTAEGFYDYKKDQYIYQYRDHLGNTRISFARNSAGALEIVDVNDYYPFGMSHLKSGTAMFGQGSYKNYKFQEQELQETGFYSFKWRNYMPDVGRFFNVDPLSEKYSYQSHYNFSENRVVNARELEGLEAQNVNEVSLPDDPIEFAEFIGGGINSLRASVSNLVGRGINEVRNPASINKYEVDSDGYLTLIVGAPRETAKEKIVNSLGDIATIGLAVAGGPEGMLMSQGGKAPALKGVEEIKAEAKLISKEAVAKNGTLQPGPFAGEGLFAKKGKSRAFDTADRKTVNKQGYTLGCHTCGQKSPGTKSGNWILDHQPPNAIALDYQYLYAHCKYCSASQGGIISAMKRNGTLPAPVSAPKPKSKP